MGVGIGIPVPKPVSIGTCCCATGGSCIACGVCRRVPLRYALTVPALTNQDCVACNEYAGNFILHWTGDNDVAPTGNCTWKDRKNAQPSCAESLEEQCQSIYGWLLQYIAPPPPGLPYYYLQANVWSFFGSDISYRLPAAQWNCTGANTLLRTFDPLLDQVACQGWPATLILTPAGPLHSCQCLICEASPNQWRLTLNGVTQNQCVVPGDCLVLNGQHILDRVTTCLWQKTIPLCNQSFILELLLERDCNRAKFSIYHQNTECRYVLPFTTFNCLGQNVLPREVNPPGSLLCTYSAPTVTIDPV